jgi:uncharacterized membrane protein
VAHGSPTASLLVNKAPDRNDAAGLGIFNFVEGIIDHHVLGIRHVNETVPKDHWVFWDIGFTLSGVMMIIAGWLIVRAGKRRTPH